MIVPAKNATNLPTACVLCSHTCGVRVDVEDGRITNVRGDESNPITRGYVCNKAYSIAKYVEHDQRVTHPLRRRADGTFERITWDVAIREIADKLSAIRAAHTARAIGLVGIGGQANHMDAGYGLGFLTGMGSKRWFNAYAQEKTQNNLVDNWMVLASPAAFLHPDQENTKYLITMGTNPRISNRGHNATDTFKAYAKRDDVTVVVVDPRETDTSKGADIHLRVRPGGDCYLMLGMLAHILGEGLHDRRFESEGSVGFADLRAALAGVAVDDMAERAGIDAAQLREVATGFARSGASSILCDLGVEQSRFSTLNAYLLRALLAVTGNLGRTGGNLFFESFNPPGSGKSRREPERALVSGIPAIRALGNYGMFSPSLVPEEIMNDHPERLRALIVEGANPLLSFSDTARWREAFDRLDLCVVIEPAMTETARLADYVLPTPVGYEKWEICGFPNGYPEIRSQLRPPVVAPPPEALPEPEIYARLAEAMNLFGPPPKPLRWLARRSPSLMTVAAMLAARRKARGLEGVQNRTLFWTYRALGPHLDAPALAMVWLLCHFNAFTRRDAVLRTLGPKWKYRTPLAIAKELYRRMLAHPEGVELAKLRTGSNLADNNGYDDKRVRVAPEPMMKEIRRAVAETNGHSAEYPMVLAAGLRTRWTANTIQRDPSWRKGKGPHCTLSMSPGDAERLGVGDGDPVILETPRGAAQLPASVDPRQRDGHVAVPNGFGVRWGNDVIGVNLNELTDAADRDPFTGCPHHKYVACRVTRG